MRPASTFESLQTSNARHSRISRTTRCRGAPPARRAKTRPSPTCNHSSRRSVSRRSGAVRAWTATGGLAAALGPVVGGLLVAVSWRWVFVVNVPIGIGALIVGYRRLPGIPGQPTRPPRALGVVLATAGVGALTFGLVEGGGWGWGSAGVVGTLGGAAACQDRLNMPQDQLLTVRLRIVSTISLYPIRTMPRPARLSPDLRNGVDQGQELRLRDQRAIVLVVGKRQQSLAKALEQLERLFRVGALAAPVVGGLLLTLDVSIQDLPLAPATVLAVGVCASIVLALLCRRRFPNWKLHEFPLAQHGIGEIQTRELVLVR